MRKTYIVLLVMLTLGITGFLFLIPEDLNGKKVTDVVSAISAIVSPIIGVLSGVAILELSLKKDNDEELMYNQDMLESLLIFTIMEVEPLVRNILSVASTGSDDGSRTIILPKDLINIDQGFILVGNGLDRRDNGYSVKQESVQSLLVNSQLDNLVYSDSWDIYLRAINKSEDRLIISKWFQVLKSSKLKCYDIIVYRDKVIDILLKSDWVKTDKSNLKNTQELLNLYLDECKEYGIEYDIIFRCE